MSLAVGVPVALSPAQAPEAPATARAAVEVAIVPASIEVVGVRTERVAATPERARIHRASFRS